MDELISSLINSDKFLSILKGIGLFVKDYETGQSFANSLWKSFGYSERDMEGTRFQECIHPEDLEFFKPIYDQLLAGRRDFYEVKLRMRDGKGKWHWVLTRGVVLKRGTTGLPTLFLGFDQDQTDLSEALFQERAAHERTKELLIEAETLGMRASIVSTELEPDAVYKAVLSQAHQMFSFDFAQIWLIADGRISLKKEMGDRGAVEDPDLPLPISAMDSRIPLSFKTMKGFGLRIPLILQNRSLGYIDLVRSQDFSPDAVRTAARFADQVVLSIQNAYNYKQTETEASLDSLTGLLTRRSFERQAQKLFQDSDLVSQVSALVLDLDLFKSINDRWGHPAGDEVLKAHSEICRRTLRESDLLCRWGGEEIAILLPGVESEDARIIAERIRLRTSETVLEEYHDLKFTVSVGLYTAPVGGTSFSGILSCADKAMYQSKIQGRNRVSIFTQ